MIRWLQERDSFLSGFNVITMKQEETVKDVLTDTKLLLTQQTKDSTQRYLRMIVETSQESKTLQNMCSSIT